jgi:TRAP-type C4-dicarboxylate transport system substrate-binding protein
MLVLALVLICGLIVTGCSTTASPSASTGQSTTAAPPAASDSGKTYNLKYSFEQATTSYYYIYGHKPYADAVDKATNGKVKITLYDSQTLIKSNQIWEGVKAGTTDMGWLFTGLFPGQFSYAEASTLPFVFPSAAVGSSVTWQIYNKYPEIQNIFKDVKVLATWTTEPYFIVSRSNFYKTLDDWNGQKVRAPGGPPTDFVKALNGSPMSVGMPDCYLNLQKGGLMLSYSS